MSDGVDGQICPLYAQAHAARAQSRLLAERLKAIRYEVQQTVQLSHAARGRAERACELWLAAFAQPGRLQYSACARLQARLASMPVIEQAKGIIMARCGWPEKQAFDALRRASQRENIKVRDLAARIVAITAHVETAQPQPAPLHAAGSRRLRKAAG
jgi:hypothetical protein